MALQGTLDTFALPDVMRLLASTNKTGCLRLDGDRGTGEVWMDAGAVVGAGASRAASDAATHEIVFELLRFADGSFTFEPGPADGSPGPRTEVEPLLGRAEADLVEWQSIAAVVPSLEAWVSLVPSLAGNEVTVDADRWRTLASIGSGNTVGRVGAVFGLSEVPACRRVKDVVEMGLVTVAAEDSIAEPEPVSEPVPEPVPERSSELESELETTAEAPPAVTEPEKEAVAAVPQDGPIEWDKPLDRLPALTPLDNDEDQDQREADEVARQLASLSPKAARAVAAAAQATTDEEREAALAEVDDDDEPINRGLLLKFLSSVRT
jgi:Domain of unknown function (DUF4388)